MAFLDECTLNESRYQDSFWMSTNQPWAGSPEGDKIPTKIGTGQDEIWSGLENLIDPDFKLRSRSSQNPEPNYCWDWGAQSLVRKFFSKSRESRGKSWLSPTFSLKSKRIEIYTNCLNFRLNSWGEFPGVLSQKVSRKVEESWGEIPTLPNL